MSGDLKSHTRAKHQCKRDLPDEVDPKLVIGIDFGTTYTGVAWGFTKNPKKIKIVDSWPGDGDLVTEKGMKVPSVIQILGDGENQFKWGYQVRTEVQAIGDFKIALEDKRHDYYPNPEPVLASINAALSTEHSGAHGQDTSTTKIVAKYIGAVYQHALDTISSREVAGVMKLSRAFVITVPAVWSDSAKRRLRVALAEAHPDLQGADLLLSEPEAAALFIMEKYQSRGVREQDTVVVCDVGGGIVEVMSYKVTAVDPKVRLEELNAATGKAVTPEGIISLSLSRHLQNVLRPSDFAALNANQSALNQIVRKLSRNLKPGFSSDKEWDRSNNDIWVELGIPISDDRKVGIQNNRLRVTGALVNSIYASLADETLGLVREQIGQVKRETGRDPKNIFLVGGYGAGPYLRNHLSKAGKLHIVEIKPDHAWAAVAKGAVLHRMPKSPTVDVTIAPFSIGVRSQMPVIPPDDVSKLGLHLLTDENEDIRRVEKMTWHILKGTPLDRDKKIVFKFYRDIPLKFTAEDVDFTDILERSDAENPPVYPWEDGSITEKCKLRTNFKDLVNQKNLLGKKRSDRMGTEYYSVYYDLLVTVESARLKFSAMWNNTEVDVQDITSDNLA